MGNYRFLNGQESRDINRCIATLQIGDKANLVDMYSDCMIIFNSGDYLNLMRAQVEDQPDYYILFS